jgi:hypothetical protein
VANIVFNIAKGEVNAYTKRVVNNDPANSALVIVLLKTAEADGVLQDYDTLGAILSAGGGTANVEANFTNYARKVLTNTELSAPTVDDAGNQQYSDAPDQTYVSAGGAVNNSLVKMVICYDADTTTGTDANLITLVALDFVSTTDGTDILASFSAEGFFVAIGVV